MRFTIVFCSLFAVHFVAAQPAAFPPIGQIVRVDPRFDALVPKGAVIEKLADGFDWSEGPVWIKAGGYLLFSNIPKNAIMKWQSGSGISTYLKPSGYSGRGQYPGREPGSNGLAVDAAGRLLICQHGDRRIARQTADGKLTGVAERFEGKRFNSPNDLVVKRNGDIYFTDPPYGLPKTFTDPGREMDFCGVFRVVPDGKVTLLTKELSAPNGLAFSPDEKTLYVANSDPARAIWMSYPIKADGTLGEGKVFVDVTAWAKAGKKGVPDGMKIDIKGNLFATGPGGVIVFAADGTHLGTLDTGVPTANCAWGDDGGTLYITAEKSLCRVKTKTRGW